MDDLLQDSLVLCTVFLGFLIVWSKDFLFDLELLQTEVQLLIATQDGCGDMKGDEGFLGGRGLWGLWGMWGMWTVFETALFGTFFLLLTLGLQQVVLEEVLGVKETA